MQAIILAAGMGKRLGAYTKDNTKCMVPVNGVRIIDRLLYQLKGHGVNQITIVVGYQSENLINYLESNHSDYNIEYIVNPIYDRTNNLYSLWLAKDRLQTDDTLLIESDLVFDDELLDLLINDSDPNVALVAKYESWMDGTMVTLDRESNIVSFIPKQSFNYRDVDSYFKTVNIYKFSKDFSSNKYVPFLEAYSHAVGKNEYYENVLRIISFLNSKELKALPVGNLKWYEIDDKQDLDIAEALFAEEKDILRKYYGRYGGFWRFPKMLDFCYLVNPYFSESRIIDEIEANFRTLISEYPSGMKVNTLLASKCWGVNEDYIVPGNGAAELIKILMETLPGTLGIVRPTFEEYPNRRDKSSVISFVSTNLDYRYSVNDLIEFFSKKKVDSLLIINPDNPSGNFIPIDEIKILAEWAENKGIRLIIDESFVDFSISWEQNTLLHDSILESFPHMLVMKSISKSYGVPGIRLGILCSADVKLIAEIKQKVSIWNINSFAEFFMQIFSKYEADYKVACNTFIEERDDFEKKLRSISFLRVMPSQANYFLCEVLPPKTANEIVLYMLKKHNILLRDCSTKEGFDGKQYLRISVRNHADNTRLIEGFSELEQYEHDAK